MIWLFVFNSVCYRPQATALLVRKLKPVENKLKSSDPCPRSRSCYLNRPSGPHWPVWPVSSGPRAICFTPLPLWGESSWRPHSLRLHICRFVFNSARFLWCFMFPCFRKRNLLKKIFLRSFILTAGFLSSVCVSFSTSAHWRSARLNEGGWAPKMHQEDQREEVQKKGSHCR